MTELAVGQKIQVRLDVFMNGERSDGWFYAEVIGINPFTVRWPDGTKQAFPKKPDIRTAEPSQ